MTDSFSSNLKLEFKRNGAAYSVKQKSTSRVNRILYRELSQMKVHDSIISHKTEFYDWSTFTIDLHCISSQFEASYPLLFLRGLFGPRYLRNHSTIF